MILNAEAQIGDARIRSQEDLQNYLDHFNNRRYEEQIAYYAPDVAYSVGDQSFTNPQQIADFYSDFHEYVKEHVEIAAFAMTGDTVAVVMPTTFEAFKAYNKHGFDFPKGMFVNAVSFIFYELKDGKIYRIRVASYSGAPEDFQK